MDAALLVTSTTTSGTRSCLLASSLMRENPDTAESKSPVGEDEAVTAQPGILLYIIWRGNSKILTIYFELTRILFSDDADLMVIFLCA